MKIDEAGGHTAMIAMDCDIRRDEFAQKDPRWTTSRTSRTMTSPGAKDSLSPAVPELVLQPRYIY